MRTSARSDAVRRFISCVAARGLALGLVVALSGWTPLRMSNRGLPRGTPVPRGAIKLSGAANPAAAFDGNVESAWCVPPPTHYGDRAAPGISVRFDRPRRITGVKLIPTHAGSMTLASRYLRPSVVHLETDDGNFREELHDHYVSAEVEDRPSRYVHPTPLERLRQYQSIQVGYEAPDDPKHLRLTPIVTSKLDLYVWDVFPTGPRTKVCISEIVIYELEDGAR